MPLDRRSARPGHTLSPVPDSRCARSLLVLVAIGAVVAVALRGMAGQAPAPAGVATRTAATLQVLVCEVLPGGPADRAGVRHGDELLKLGDRPLDSFDALAAVLNAYRPGDRAIVALRRGQAEQLLTITFGERDGRVYLGLTGCPPGVVPPRTDPASP